MIRVLVVEDSAVTREYLAYLLEQDPALGVVGMAGDGLDAVEQAERLDPDVILMDVHMPRMNGLEATRRIMARVPTPIVMVTAVLSHEGTAIAFEALAAGALTVVDKPRGLDRPDQAETTRRLIETVRLMADVKAVRQWPSRGRPASPSLPSPAPDRTIRLVAIGASTGGPAALGVILRALPGDLAAPLLVVQHIAPGFVTGLANWLGKSSRLRVKVAEPDEPARPGTAYLPPDGVQMRITTEDRILLMREATEGAVCPSADHLFQSVAETYGRAAIGIVLAGTGRDGAVGLRRLREAGGVTIAQDEESSAAFGMPGEAIRLEAAEYVLSPARIARAIRALATPV